MAEESPGAPGPGGPGPKPYRLSDAERDEAISALADAFADGRLDAQEFDSRMAAASEAVFASELDPLFADLTRPARSRPRREPPLERSQMGHSRREAALARQAEHRARYAAHHGYGYRRPGPPLFLLPLLLLVGLAAATGLWFVIPLGMFFLVHLRFRRRMAYYSGGVGSCGQRRQLHR